MTDVVLTVVGERVALGPIRRDQLPLYYRWNNDLDVLRTTSSVRATTLEAFERLFDASIGADDQLHFTIYERESVRPVGGVNLQHINHRDRNAQFAIAIGEKDCWGKGYGTEATRLMLDYAFNALGLHTVLLWVLAYNTAGMRAYQRAGFVEAGRWHEAHRLGQVVHDVVFMECRATAFESPVLAAVLKA
ncbi:MAG TPA: GNAT family protein [Chloroflexota bacterium]|jgi:RimJ/RimL family protein N-acetyltransferase